MCYSVSPEFAHEFTFPKSRGNGEFTIDYIYAAFNKEGGSGEFYLEIKEQIREHQLIERFEKLGACQVSVVTFPNNDKDESASNALAHVRFFAEQTSYSVVRGECSPALYEKATVKLLEMNTKHAADVEFEEKTQSTLKMTLAVVDAKVDHVQEGVTEVNDGVKWMIEQQKRMTVMEEENKRQAAEIKRINKLRDQLEQRVGKETEYKNKYEAAEAENKELKTQMETKNKFISVLESMHAVHNALECAKWVITSSDRTMDLSIKAADAATRIINDERASKRARTDEDDGH
jgi:DNA repair exonuclease SbcCD ATPase subunit